MKVISPKNLPTRAPVTFTIVIYLLLDHSVESDLVWGIVIALLAIIWIVSVIAMWKEERVEILKD